MDLGTDVATLAAQLGPGRVLTTLADRAAAGHDAGLDRGTPLAVVRPADTAQVACVVRWAREAGVAVVARGAGSGLAGGAVPGPLAVVLALDGLNALVIDPLDRVAVCGPGAITADVDDAAAAHGLMYPPDPASWRQCTVGGNAATNAGGPRCLKYGVTSAYIQGLTAVLADGAVISLGGRALEPAGPDLMGLLAGSEGTLVIVTELVLRLVPRPRAAGTLLAAFDGAAAAGAAVADIMARGLVPAAMELMDRAMLDLITADPVSADPNSADPSTADPSTADPSTADSWLDAIDHAAAIDGLSTPVQTRLAVAGAVLIVEVDGHAASIAPQLAAVAAAIEACGGRCRAATDDGERAALWAGRRRAGLAALRPTGAYHTADAAVPPSRLPAMIGAVATICAAHGRPYGLVAHAGDGNLHPLLPFDPRSPDDARAVDACVAEIAAAAVAEGGTISGEHGVGLAKRAYLPWLFDAPTLAAMHDVKTAFDPVGTLNPGKVLPARGDPGAPWPLAAPSRGGSVAGAYSRPLPTPRTIGIAADNLVLTASGATTVAQATSAARDAGTLLPLASPWSADTLADVIGQRLEAPWRLRYGGIGDQLLTVSATLPDGRVIHAGRAVRKHVAGYALGRLFVGAAGTMGHIQSVGLRLVPAPPVRTSLVIPVDGLAAAVVTALAARDALLTSSALLVVPATIAPGPAAEAAWAIISTAEGTAPDVDADVSHLEAIAEERLGRQGTRVDHAPDDLGGVAVWGTAIAEAVDAGAPLVRLAVPLGGLLGALRACTADTVRGLPVLIDIGTGQLYIRCGDDSSAGGPSADDQMRVPDAAHIQFGLLRHLAARLGGHAALVAHPSRGDPMPAAGPNADVTRLTERLIAGWRTPGLPGADHGAIDADGRQP